MKHIGKIVSLVTIFSILTFSNVNAAELNASANISQKSIKSELKLTKAKVEKIKGATITTVTDPDELKNPDVIAGAEIPEGYKLVEVKIGVSNSIDEKSTALPSSENPITSSKSSTIQPQSTSDIFSTNYYYAKNPVVNPIEVYFPNSPDYSDWYDGPSSVSISEARGFNANYSSSVGLSKGVISATVGFDVGTQYSRTVTYSVNVDAGKKVNVKVFSNNKETKFEEWLRVTTLGIVQSDSRVGYGYGYKPIGAIWKQYTYSK